MNCYTEYLQLLSNKKGRPIRSLDKEAMLLTLVLYVDLQGVFPKVATLHAVPILLTETCNVGHIQVFFNNQDI